LRAAADLGPPPGVGFQEVRVNALDRAAARSLLWVVMSVLSGLSQAPWSSQRSSERLAQVIARYQGLLDLALRPAGKGRQTVALLLGHPGALLEAEHSDPETLARRRSAAEAEHHAVLQGAALPPPPADDGRVRLHALADLTWVVRELRTLRMLRRRYPSAESLCVGYRASDRADPLPLQGPDLWAASTVPGARVRREVLAVLAQRYGRPDLAAWVLPASPGQRPEPVDAGASHEITSGCPKQVEAFGRSIAVFRHEGRLYALDDTCPHRGAALSEGKVDASGAVLCPLHAWPFDLETGAYRENANLTVRTYEVVERDERVLLMGPGK